MSRAGEAEAKINEVVGKLDNKSLKIQPPNMLVNVQNEGQQPVSKQSWHVDLCEDQRGLVAIGAVERATLLVFPGSRAEVQEFLRLEKLVADEKIKKTELVALLRSRRFEAVRVVMEPGDLLFMTGDTIHAGDRGVERESSIRIHWYIMEGDTGNSTMHLKHFGSDFERCFQ